MTSGHGERVSRRAHTPETGRFDSGARYHFLRDLRQASVISISSQHAPPAMNHRFLIGPLMSAVSSMDGVGGMVGKCQ